MYMCIIMCARVYVFIHMRTHTTLDNMQTEKRKESAWKVCVCVCERE